MFPKQIKIIAFSKHRELVKKTSSRDRENFGAIALIFISINSEIYPES